MPLRPRILLGLIGFLGLAAVAAVILVTVAWTRTPAADDLPMRIGARETPAAQIAPVMEAAVVATEDERFYHHHGVDLIGVLRAVPYDLYHHSLRQGASTITEQLAKLVYLHGNDHSFWRKLEGAVLAFKLESHYSKREILAAYLARAYFGHGAWGIRQASERYFGRAPSRLTLPQGSLLAGLLQAPSAYDPFVDPSAARGRQIDVIRSMVRNGSITPVQGVAALAVPLRLRGGARLAPITDVRLERGSRLGWGTLFGALMLVLGLTLIVFARRLRRGSATGWRAIGLAGTIVGVLALAAVYPSL